MKSEDIKHQTKKVLLELLPNVSIEDLSDDSNIFSLGLDSIYAMALVSKLQDAFDIQLENSEINFDNFQNLTTIVELIERKNVNNTVF